MSKWRVIGVRTLKPKLEKMTERTLRKARRLVKGHATKIEAVAINRRAADAGATGQDRNTGFRGVHLRDQALPPLQVSEAVGEAQVG